MGITRRCKQPGQADVRQIRISTDKVAKRAGDIESVELEAPGQVAWMTFCKGSQTRCTCQSTFCGPEYWTHAINMAGARVGGIGFVA